MIGSLALLLIGAADLIRAHVPRRAGWVVTGVWFVLLVATVLLLGAPIWAAGVSTAIGLGWLLTMTADDARRPPGGIWPALALGGVLIILIAVDPSAAGLHGPLVDALGDSPSAALRDTPVRMLLLVLGGAIFLIESANVITRAALHRDGFREAAPGTFAAEPVVETRSRWSFARGKASTSAAEKPVPDLKGGRAIGPLERLAITGLVLVGAYAIVGAVLAGKGIVRFPEISKDSGSGSKAEYFLVGSLSSWTIALAMAGYIALAR